MRSPRAGGRAPRTRARRPPAPAGRAPAPLVDGPPHRYYTTRCSYVPSMARLVGINHVALEVGDVEEALAWYGRFFEIELRGRAGGSMAFIDMGDQFIALARGRTQPPDGARHFGLVVDDKDAVRAALVAAGAEVTRGAGGVEDAEPVAGVVQGGGPVLWRRPTRPRRRLSRVLRQRPVRVWRLAVVRDEPRVRHVRVRGRKLLRVRVVLRVVGAVVRQPVANAHPASLELDP